MVNVFRVFPPLLRRASASRSWSTRVTTVPWFRDPRQAVKLGRLVGPDDPRPPAPAVAPARPGGVDPAQPRHPPDARRAPPSSRSRCSSSTATATSPCRSPPPRTPPAGPGATSSSSTRRSHSWLLKDPETLPAIMHALMRGRLGTAVLKAQLERGRRPRRRHRRRGRGRALRARRPRARAHAPPAPPRHRGPPPPAPVPLDGPPGPLQATDPREVKRPPWKGVGGRSTWVAGAADTPGWSSTRSRPSRASRHASPTAATWARSSVPRTCASSTPRSHGLTLGAPLRLSLSDGRVLAADVVALATGRPPGTMPEQLARALAPVLGRRPRVLRGRGPLGAGRARPPRRPQAPAGARRRLGPHRRRRRAAPRRPRRRGHAPVAARRPPAAAPQDRSARRAPGTARPARAERPRRTAVGHGGRPRRSPARRGRTGGRSSTRCARTPRACGGR